MLPRNCPAVPNNHHWWGSPAKYLQATSNDMGRKKRPSWGGPLRPLTPDGGLHLVGAFLRSISPRTEARVSFQRRVGPGQQAIQIERPFRVKGSKAQTEQMFSGLCLKADASCLWSTRPSTASRTRIYLKVELNRDARVGDIYNAAAFSAGIIRR